MERQRKENVNKMRELMKDVPNIPLHKKKATSSKRKKDDYIPMEEYSESESDSNSNISTKKKGKKNHAVKRSKRLVQLLLNVFDFGRYDREAIVEAAALIKDMGLMKPVSAYAEKILNRKRKLTFLNEKHHQWYDRDASNRYNKIQKSAL